MRIPKELVFLGLAQTADIIEDVDGPEDEDEEIYKFDMRGNSFRERQRASSDRRVWIMATDPDSVEAPPGEARLYFIKAPFTRDLTPDSNHEPTDEALDSFYLWNQREADRTFTVDTPDEVGTYYGKITRIVYASDKWDKRGKVTEYDHDFYENDGEPPFIYFDDEDPEFAEAAIIYGGTMSINERGII